ncbi:MAG: hypothetical protein LUD47_01395 [Clostridia bacterium]|nr:hypothetical protein [Clostridia bacterium]
MRAQIAKRDELKKKHDELVSRLPTSPAVISENFDPFETDIYVKESLATLIVGATMLKRRDGVSEIQRFLSEPGRFDVLLLSGMKGAGNTTMMYQTIADMTDEDFGKTAPCA